MNLRNSVTNLHNASLCFYWLPGIDTVNAVASFLFISLCIKSRGRAEIEILGRLTNQSRVDPSEQTEPSNQSEQIRPITTDWTIWPIRAD